MVVNSGNVVPFAQGGVINQLTAFGLGGKKMGVAGEGGQPEGILPLLRGRGGRLGVEVMNPEVLGRSSGNMNLVVNNQTNIETKGGAGEKRELEEMLSRSNRELVKVIDTQIARKFRNGNHRTMTAQAARAQR